MTLVGTCGRDQREGWVGNPGKACWETENWHRLALARGLDFGLFRVYWVRNAARLAWSEIYQARYRNLIGGWHTRGTTARGNCMVSNYSRQAWPAATPSFRNSLRLGTFEKELRLHAYPQACNFYADFATGRDSRSACLAGFSVLGKRSFHKSTSLLTLPVLQSRIPVR